MKTWGGWFTSKSTFPLRIFIIALVLRLVPVIAGRDLPIGLDDMFQYDMLGRSIVSGNGYRWYAQDDLRLIERYFTFDKTNYDPAGVVTAFRAPFYPLFLAAIYFFSGVGAPRFLVARIVQAFVGALLPALTYAVARKLFPENERIASASAGTVAVYPMFIAFPLALATENLFFILFIASVYALLAASEKRTTAAFVGAGLTLGLTALTRSVVLIAAGLALLWLWFILKERRGAVLAALALALVISPWMIRNALLFQRPVIELSGGYNLYVGYHPKGDGNFQYGISVDLMPILDDGERERLGTEKALTFIRDDPARVLYLAVHRLGHFFNLERRAWEYFYSNNFFGPLPFAVLLTAALILILPFVVVAPSALMGLVVTRWRNEIILVALMMAGYLLPHTFILAEDRFHLTLVPLLAIFAAAFWTGGWSSVRTAWMASPRHRLLVVLAGACILLLFLNWSLDLYGDWERLSLLFGPNGNHANFSY